MHQARHAPAVLACGRRLQWRSLGLRLPSLCGTPSAMVKSASPAVKVHAYAAHAAHACTEYTDGQLRVMQERVRASARPGRLAVCVSDPLHVQGCL